MKTIKELKAIRNEANELSVKTFMYGKIEALKDVLKLIKEFKSCMCSDCKKELKSRIEGK